MAFPGSTKLLDFAAPFDVPMLDQIITAFYTPGADPSMVRSDPLFSSLLATHGTNTRPSLCVHDPYGDAREGQI